MTSQRMKNRMASNDVHSVFKAISSLLFKRLRQEFSLNNIKWKNNDRTCLFEFMNFFRVPQKKFEHSSSYSFLGNRQMLMHEKPI